MSQVVRIAWRKARSDARANRLQTAMFLVVVAIATAIITLAFTASRAANNPWERTFEASKGIHVWFGSQNRADLPKLDSVSGVQAAVGPFESAIGQLRAGGGGALVQVSERPTAMGEVGHPLVTRGRWLAGPGETVLDRQLARELGVGVGADVRILVNGHGGLLRVVGLGFDPSREPYPASDYAQSFVVPSDLDRLQPFEGFWEQGLRLVDGSRADAVAESVKASQPRRGRYGTQTWTQVSENLVGDVRLAQIVLTVFAFFALVVAALVLGNMAGGTVLSQFREIGVLKALGMAPAQVVGLYLLILVGLGLGAAVAGVAIGLAAAPILAKQAADVLRATQAPGLGTVGIALIVAGVAGFVGLVVAIPAIRAGRIPTVQALTTGYTTAADRASLLGRVARRLRLRPAAVTGVKDALARPGRAGLTIASLTLGVVTMTFVLGLAATLSSAQKDPTVLGMDPGDVFVGRTRLSDPQARAILARVPGVADYVAMVDADATMGRSGPTFDMRFFEQPRPGMAWRLQGGRMASGQNEVAISVKLAEASGLRIGGSLQATVGERSLVLRIVGVYYDDSDNAALASIDAAHRVAPDLRPDQYLVKAAPGVGSGDLEERIRSASGGDFGTDDIKGHIRDVLLPIGATMLLLNLGLLLIAGANTLATTLLSVRERVHDLAIFKSIGMTPRQVTLSVLAGVTVLGLAAVVIGAPLGTWVTHELINWVGDQEGAGRGIGRTAGPVLLLALLPITLAVAWLGSYLPARRAAGIATAEALRYE